MLKVLWLCSWYPNSVESEKGDFIQRHAQSASLMNEIAVIKVTADPDAKAVNKVTRTFQQWPNLSETLIYYPKPSSFIGNTVAYLRWYSIYKYAVENYIEKNGKPDLIHVHVPHKSGVIARLIKRKYKIPYVVTEHWNGYDKSIPENYKQRDYSFRTVIKDALKTASSLQVTNSILGEQINKLVTKIPFVVIPSAVNTQYFNYRQKENNQSKFRLLHISESKSVKEISTLIEAFQKLNDDQFALTILGLPGEQNESLQRMYPSINFAGCIPYRQISDYLNNTDICIVNGNMINASGVIGEALCCGVPVVCNEAGASFELINSTNGILVRSGDINSLVDAIERIRMNINSYEGKQIADVSADNFSYNQVGFETDLWYKSALLSLEESKT